MEDVVSLRVLRRILARHGLAPRKALGQNFLIDANLRNKILQSAAPGPEDLVVEVGAGPGTLTPGLLAGGGVVLAVEADRRLAAILTERLSPFAERAVVLVADVLRLDLVEAAAAHGWATRPALAVGNLPYYITSPCLFHLLETPLRWRRMVFLVQREVAARITAPPGTKDYGLLSVMLQYRTVPTVVAVLPPSVFWPPPKVHSALLRLDLPGRYPSLSPREEEIFRGLVKAAFGQRRKTLANSCRAWTEHLGLTEEFTSTCREADVDPNRRGEELTVEEFMRLAKALAAAIPTPTPDAFGTERKNHRAIHQSHQR
ncbi:MAG: 16S rRNA (adenine(1518)-N(6)/adenine(1519)-N(6))-dimethyltransferase RsmA [Firmicutes bacterium]|nr:16S rRNA (adenine(1518)-N(6)/adenine(1519)-N(6))-dimethyltransferase RsmA [Bacillota bacterium]